MDSRQLSKKDFIQELINVMNNADFKEFYNNYCSEPSTWSDIEAIILYMKLLEIIKLKYKEKYNHEAPNTVLYNTVHKIMTNSDARKHSIEIFGKYKNGNMPKNLSITNFIEN